VCVCVLIMVKKKQLASFFMRLNFDWLWIVFGGTNNFTPQYVPWKFTVVLNSIVVKHEVSDAPQES